MKTKKTLTFVTIALLSFSAFLAFGFWGEKPDNLVAKWEVPDTPTGKQVAAFCEAIDRVDEAYAKDYLKNHITPSFLSSVPMKEHMRQFKWMHENIGKFELLGVKKTGPTSAELSLKSKQSGKRFKASLDFDETADYRIAGIQVKASGGYGLTSDSNAQCTTSEKGGDSCCAGKK